MVMITIMTKIAAAPPDPMIGILKLSSESVNEKVVSSIRGSASTVL